MLGFAYCELTAYYGDCVLNKGMTLDEAYVATRSPKNEVLAYAFVARAMDLYKELQRVEEVPH